MSTLLSVFVTIIVLCLIFSLLYWLVLLVGRLLPAPVREPFTTLMLILLVLLAVLVLVDATGLIGTSHFSRWHPLR